MEEGLSGQEQTLQPTQPGFLPTIPEFQVKVPEELIRFVGLDHVSTLRAGRGRIRSLLEFP